MSGITIKTLRNENTKRWVQITRNNDLKEFTFAIGDFDKLVAYDSVVFKIDNHMSSWNSAIMHAEWMTKHC